MPTIAEISLSYKSTKPVEILPVITSPEDAEQFLRSIWDEDTLELREEFVVILLNNARKCLGWSKISTGGSTATIVDPAAVFQTALLSNANSLLLAHNHPSGMLRASVADINLTKRIKEAGKLLGIELDDHIILTRDGFLSMQSEGLF